MKDEELAVKAARSGVLGYLVKGRFDSNLLMSSIRYAIERHRLLAEVKPHIATLEHSKTYIESIIQNFLDTRIVVDAEAKIQTVNPATCQLSGYREEEILGQLALFLQKTDRQTELFQILCKPEKAEPPRSQDTIRNRGLTYKTKDRGLISMLFDASVLTDEAGSVTSAVSGAKDITELKLAARAMREKKEGSKIE